MFREDYSLGYDNKEVINKIYEYLFNKKEISMAYIFGSFDTDDFNCNSDIDIAILPAGEISYEQCLKMNSDLEDLIGLPIDLNNIESLPEYIQVQILIENRQLFSKDDILEQRFIDKVNHWIKTEFPFWKKVMQEI